MTEMPPVRRPLLNILDEQGCWSARLDILVGGTVRLRVQQGTQFTDLLADTLEDLALDAAASELPTPLYESLLWELNMLGLQGE